MSFSNYPPIPPPTYDQQQQNITRSCNMMPQQSSPIAQSNHSSSCPATPAGMCEAVYQPHTPQFNAGPWNTSQPPNPLPYQAISQPLQAYPCPPIPPQMYDSQQQQQQLQNYSPSSQPHTPPPLPPPSQSQMFSVMGQPPNTQVPMMAPLPPPPPLSPPTPPQQPMQGYNMLKHPQSPPLPAMQPQTPPQQPMQAYCGMEHISAPPTPPAFVNGIIPGSGGDHGYKQKRKMSPPPHKVPKIIDDSGESFREETKVIGMCKDYLVKEVAPFLGEVRNETYQKLCFFRTTLYMLLDTAILTPYELAAHSEVSLMCAAYFTQFCLYYSEFQYPVPVPEEVQRGYGGRVSPIGVVISHELPFTAMQDQAKKSSITGIVVGKSMFAIGGELRAPGEKADVVGSTEALVQDVVDVTDDDENKLKECYPLWRMYNFKIKYAPNKGQPVQIKFRVPVNDIMVEFNTEEFVGVRTNDTQTHSFGAKTFIERLIGGSKDKTVSWKRTANMVQKYFVSCNKNSSPMTSDQRGVNDHDFDYLKARIMGGKDAGITKEDIEALFTQVLTPVLSSYKGDAAITRYWDKGVNFGLVPRESALRLARAHDGAVLFFCCEKPGNFGVATANGDCFFIETGKLTKFKTIGSLILGERSITRVLTFKRKAAAEYSGVTTEWWDNLTISAVDKNELFQNSGKKNNDKDQGVPEGYIRLE